MRPIVIENPVINSAYKDLRKQHGCTDNGITVEHAIKRGAAALVLVHNHPNGHAEPSEQDKTLTRALVLAAEPLYLKILDHLIVSPDEAFSFRKAGPL